MASLINDKCTNCKICATVCPTSSIFPGGQHYVIDSDTCEDCHLCAKVCPVDAIKIGERKPTPEELAAKEAATHKKDEKGKVKPKTW
jgi:ferredoxin